MVETPITLMLEWLKQDQQEFEDSSNDMKPYLRKPTTEEDPVPWAT